MKSRIVKGSNVPSINLSKEIIAVLSRLDADEVKEIIVGIRDYVYKDKEPKVNEEITDIMDMTLDNINHIAKGYLNGKKGGRPRREETPKESINNVKPEEFEIPNTDDLTPSNNEDDNLCHQEGESPSEGLKTTKEEEIDDNINNTEEDMGTFIGDFKELNSKTTTPNVEEEFDNFSDELNDLLDANEAKTEQIAQAKYLRKYLGIKNDAAYELSIKYYNQLKEQLTTEKDIEDLNKYLREKAEMKHYR